MYRLIQKATPPHTHLCNKQPRILEYKSAFKISVLNVSIHFHVFAFILGFVVCVGSCIDLFIMKLGLLTQLSFIYL